MMHVWLYLMYGISYMDHCAIIACTTVKNPCITICTPDFNMNICTPPCWHDTSQHQILQLCFSKRMRYKGLSGPSLPMIAGRQQTTKSAFLWTLRCHCWTTLGNEKNAKEVWRHTTPYSNKSSFFRSSFDAISLCDRCNVHDNHW